MTFVPRGSEVWTSEQWEIFNSCYPVTAAKIAVNPDAAVQFSFDGDHDCNGGDGDCSWDGMSRRCDCGNRRVYWTFDGDWVYPATD